MVYYQNDIALETNMNLELKKIKLQEIEFFQVSRSLPLPSKSTSINDTSKVEKTLTSSNGKCDFSLYMKSSIS